MCIVHQKQYTIAMADYGKFLQVCHSPKVIRTCQIALFGSTSPSYLVLQSLDMVNRYLADGYQEYSSP